MRKTGNLTGLRMIMAVSVMAMLFAFASFAWSNWIEKVIREIVPFSWEPWLAPGFFALVALLAMSIMIILIRGIARSSLARKLGARADVELAKLAWQDLPGNHFWLWSWQTGNFIFAADWLAAFGYDSTDQVREMFDEKIKSVEQKFGSRPLLIWELLLHADDVSNARESLVSYKDEVNSGRPLEQQYRIKSKGNDYRHISCKSQAIRDAGGAILGLASVFQDITSEMVVTEKLAEEKSFTEGLINSTDLFVLVLDTSGRIQRFNPFAERLTGYAEEEIVGKSWIECLFREADKPDMRRLFERARINQAVRQKRANIMAKNGRELELIWHYHPLTNHEGKTASLAVIGLDVTDRRLLERQLYEMAFYDKLTGLANQARLEQSLKTMITKRGSRDEAISVIYFDVDHFKHVNDALGYSAGDELLQLIANRLRGLVSEDDVAARLGEDEFVLLLTSHRSERSVGALVSELQRILHEPWQKENHTFQITISTGVSFFPQHGTDIKTLLQHASIALFNAKDRGRNQVCFYDQQMYLRNLRYIDQVNQLHLAINEKQFVLHYQLQFDLKTGQPRGAEALIRWNHPQRGLISPQSFIPLAEAAGCINEISQWVMQEASRQKKLWNENGIFIEKVAINLSSYCFRLKDLTDIVCQSLDQCDLPGNDIELEITESALFENINDALDKINYLKQRGITFVLDDFGTGYSSLTYLRMLPVRMIKIDKSFIRTMLENTTDAHIVRAIIDLAHDLELTVVAEGIETPEQMRLLQSYNCDFGQGFLFHRPQPADEITVEASVNSIISVRA